MEFSLECPACRVPYAVPASLAGAGVTCGRCGADFVAVPDPYARFPREAPDASGAAVTSLVLGIPNLGLWICPPLGLIVGVIGLVLGIRGLASRRRGLAIFGILMHLGGIVVSLGWGVLFGFIAYREQQITDAGAQGNRPPFFNR